MTLSLCTLLQVISCLENSRSSHMIARPEACGDTGCTDAACGGEQHAGVLCFWLIAEQRLC